MRVGGSDCSYMDGFFIYEHIHLHVFPAEVLSRVEDRSVDTSGDPL